LICLVPEICMLTGIDDVMRKNFQQMRQFSEITRVQPSERIKKLLKLNQRFQSNENCVRTFQDNDLVLGRELVRVTGRQMEPQIILVENDIKEMEYGNNSEWSDFLKRKKMYRAAGLKKWVLICPRSIEEECVEFINLMTGVGAEMGMEIGKYLTCSLPDNRIGTYLNYIDQILLKDPSFIVVVLEKSLADHYAAIKKKCCGAVDSSNGVPTQIILRKTLDSKNRSAMSIATKIAIQINCKLGGIPWIVSMPLNGLLVIGFDVTQDSQNKKKTYGAMVAHIDPKNEGGSFYSCVSRHEHGDVISTTFGTNVAGVVKHYHEIKGTLPSRIIIYRDGVGDGQIEYVNNIEVKDVVNKINRIYRYDQERDSVEDRPRISFVIVNKRINTRFFYE
jgi:aubergine